MAETQEQWYNRQAIEQLAQHIPFERDTASKGRMDNSAAATAP